METLNKLPWAKSPIFKKVSEISDISALSREERINYDHAKKVYRDNLCVYESEYVIGVMEGFMEGFKKGMEKGAREKALSIAKEMKKYNTDISFIVKITGLTIEEIKDL